jgi:hypothetical protein
MGDRANVRVQENHAGDGVYLYTHWCGTELPVTVQRALKRRLWWTDASYLARIVFCGMVAGVEEEETGYGISQNVGDGDDRILVLNVPEQVVRVGRRTYTFEEFVNLPEEQVGW